MDAACEIASRDFLRDVRRLSTGLLSPPPPPPPRPSAGLLFSLSFNPPPPAPLLPSLRHSIPSLPPRLSFLHHTHTHTAATKRYALTRKLIQLLSSLFFFNLSVAEISVALCEKKNKKQSGYEHSDRYWNRFHARVTSIFAFSPRAKNC